MFMMYISQSKISELYETDAFLLFQQKPTKNTPKPYDFYNAYAQSWVYDVDQATGSKKLATCTKALHNRSLRRIESEHNIHHKNYIPRVSESPENKDPVVNSLKSIEKTSIDGTINNDKKIGNMKNFSETTLSSSFLGSFSQSSLNISETKKPQINAYLEKLPQSTVNRSNSSVLSDNEESKSLVKRSYSTMHLRENESPRSEKGQYTSFMQELQDAIVSKKGSKYHQSTQESQTNMESSSRRESPKPEPKSTKGEFSRKLEAALQLIQESETNNTVETSLEKKTLGEFRKRERPTVPRRNYNAKNEENDETQSRIDSMEELSTPLRRKSQESQIFNSSSSGGVTIIVHNEPNSQSTSGYSSPCHSASFVSTSTQNWSPTSSMDGSNTEIANSVSHSIRNSKYTTVITLGTPYTEKKKEKSITLVSITGDKEPVTQMAPSEMIQSSTRFETETTLVKSDGLSRSESTLNKNVSNGWRSLLRKKKQTPKLCPELESAIIKSESLAYLSEMELLARHQRNNEMHRVSIIDDVNSVNSNFGIRVPR